MRVRAASANKELRGGIADLHTAHVCSTNKRSSNPPRNAPCDSARAPPLSLFRFLIAGFAADINHIHGNSVTLGVVTHSARVSSRRPSQILLVLHHTLLNQQPRDRLLKRLHLRLPARVDRHRALQHAVQPRHFFLQILQVLLLQTATLQFVTARTTTRETGGILPAALHGCDICNSARGLTC